MSWLVFTILGALSVTGMFACMRILQHAEIDPRVFLCWLFAFTSVSYLTIALFSHDSLTISGPELGLIALTGGVAVLTNLFSQIGMARASNPGYSLSINKSSIIATTIISILFLGGKLTLAGFLGLLIMLMGIVIVSVRGRAIKSSPNTNATPLNWVGPSCLAALGNSAAAFLMKSGLSDGITPAVFLYYLSVIATLMYLGWVWLRNRPAIRVSKHHLWIILLAALASTCGNVFLLSAYLKAPNIGYAEAIQSLSIPLVAIVSAFWLKDSLSLRRIFGMLIILVGASLIGLYG